jgi:hypothetical protein
MRSLIVALAGFVLVLTTASGASAALSVTFKDGSTTLLSKSASSPAGQNTTLFLLSCATPPCSTTFGNFRFEDLSATSRARVVKTDGASVDKVELKGLRITALAGSRTLTASYQVALGDLTAISGNLYPYTAALAGSFTGSTGTGAANACTTTTSTQPFCVKLAVVANGNTINVAGSETQASVSVPPIATLSGVFPTGLSDTETIQCGTVNVAGSCRPTLQATLTARFNRAGERLTLPGSGVSANSNRPVHQEGQIDLCSDLEDLACTNSFVAFTSQTQDYQASMVEPKPNRSGLVPRRSNITVSFDVLRPTTTVPAPTYPLVALGSADPLRSEGDEAVSARAFVAFVPTEMRLRDLTMLLYDYAVVVGDGFADCQDGSFRIDITLADETGEPRHVLKLYLGQADDLGNGCSLAALSGTNLLDDDTRRVDTSTLPDGRCCFRLSYLVSTLGGKDSPIVRSISLVLESRDGIDQKVDLRAVQVNGFSFLPEVAAGFERTCDPPLQGRTIRLIKQSGPGAGDTILIPDSAIATKSCRLQTKVPLTQLAPDPGPTTYRAELCINGRCLQTPGVFELE